MKSRISYIERANNPYSLDPESIRYRVCPYCEQEFMAIHLSEEYCCNKCANDYYNQFIRKKKKTISDQITKNEEKLNIAEPKPLLTCVEILDRMQIDPEKGLIVNIDTFIASGFDLNAFSERISLTDKDPTNKCHALRFGIYYIYWKSLSEFLIERKINKT